MSNLLKGLLGTVLGVGKGAIGSAIRVGVASVSGWLLSKGVDVDTGTITSLEAFLLGLSGAFFTYLGSVLNNKVVS